MDAPSDVLVLVAEDDDEMRDLIARALMDDGCRVIAARDGDSLLIAWEAAKAAGHVPDVVVTDIRMPYSSGLEVADQLSTQSTRVVVISAFVDPETAARARAMGAYVMSKPFELDDLRTLVMNLHSGSGRK